MSLHVNLLKLGLTHGETKGNRAIGRYWECLGHVLTLPADAVVDVFNAGDAVLPPSPDDIARFATVRALIRFSVPLAVEDSVARYYPSRRDDGLAACVLLSEVDAVVGGPAMLLQALALHQATAAACGLAPLPISVHMARMVLRGMDCEMQPILAARVVNGAIVA